jgi:hypothetical protein
VRPLTLSGFALAIGVALVVLPAAAAGTSASDKASPARVAANSTTYQDSTGEDPQGPDITTIVVSNDDAGMVTFRVNIPNRPQYGRDIAAVIFLDSDANQATGDAQNFGTDYVIQLLLGEILLFKWDGADYTVAATQSSLSYAWSGGPTIRINTSDLGNTRRFTFDVTVVTGLVFDETTGDIDDANARRDFAPAVGLFTYEVQIARPTLVVRRVTSTPLRAKAGRPFSVRLVAVRSDTGAALQNGRVTCVGRAGTTRLRAQLARVTGGAAVCTWMIPANAKGKTFRGSVTVAFEGLRASGSISRKIT